MRALEHNAGFGRFMVDPDRFVRDMKHRVEKTKSCIDTKTPRSLLETKKSKQVAKRKKNSNNERQAAINKDNLDLAHRLFKIMDHPSEVAKHIQDTRHLDVHPGTMNFPVRLEEAKRIHDMNLRFAHRLDKVEPVYKRSQFGVKIRKSSKYKNKIMKKNNDKKPHTAGVGHYIGNGALLTQASHASASPSFKRSMNKKNNDPMSGSQSARRPEPDENPKITATIGNKQPLLEYTKIQNGRVIDVIIMKENNDSYSIKGADIDTGRKYELLLNSQDVAGILDGDILVTSTDQLTDSVEIWMTLLSKVLLIPIDGVIIEDKDTMKAQDLDSYFTPHEPEGVKPSKRPTRQTYNNQSSELDNTKGINIIVTGEDGITENNDPVVVNDNNNNNNNVEGNEIIDVGQNDKSERELGRMERSKLLGVLQQTPGAFDADPVVDDAARLIQTKMKGIQVQKRISQREEENKSKKEEDAANMIQTVMKKRLSISNEIGPETNIINEVSNNKNNEIVTTDIITTSPQDNQQKSEDIKRENAAVSIQVKMKGIQIEKRISERIEAKKNDEAAIVIQGAMKRLSVLKDQEILINNNNNDISIDNNISSTVIHTTPKAPIGESSNPRNRQISMNNNNNVSTTTTTEENIKTESLDNIIATSTVSGLTQPMEPSSITQIESQMTEVNSTVTLEETIVSSNQIS